MPATGKSHFGKWLETEQGYVHVDAEMPGQLARIGVHGLWDRSIETGDATALASALCSLGSPVVINWGFPPPLLPFVRALKDAGLALWWFDAEAAVSRAEYIRAGRPTQAFDTQFRGIAAARQVIEAMFAPNIITTLDANAVRLSPATIFHAICNAGTA
ncbi:MAG: hypothetical protein WAM78_11295 [Candidatus Sulfotelmatobacter sp.]